MAAATGLLAESLGVHAQPHQQRVQPRAGEGVCRFLPGGGLAPAYYGARTLGAGIRAVPNEDAAGTFERIGALVGA